MKKQIIYIGTILATFSAQALENKTIDYAIENESIVVLTSYDNSINEMFDVFILKNGQTVSKSQEMINNGIGFFHLNNKIPELKQSDVVEISFKSTMQDYSHEIQLSKSALNQLGAKDVVEKESFEKNHKNLNTLKERNYYKHESEKRINKQNSKHEIINETRKLGKLFTQYRDSNDSTKLENFIYNLEQNDFSYFTYRDCERLNDGINREYERASRRFKDNDFVFFEDIKHISCNSEYDRKHEDNNHK